MLGIIVVNRRVFITFSLVFKVVILPILNVKVTLIILYSKLRNKRTKIMLFKLTKNVSVVPKDYFNPWSQVCSNDCMVGDSNTVLSKYLFIIFYFIF